MPIDVMSVQSRKLLKGEICKLSPYKADGESNTQGNNDETIKIYQLLERYEAA